VTDKQDFRTDVEWETVAVTALPAGWHNRYGPPDNLVIACPALLVQEARTYLHSWDETDDDGRLRRRAHQHGAQPLPETRVVFADHYNGELGAACEVATYLTTTGPGEEELPTWVSP
jgi:hypothetical protein